MSDVSTAWLTLRRTDDDDVQEREVYVSLDGRKLGVLTFGDEATLEVAPGAHELRVHNTLSRKRLAFEAAPGQHVRVAVANVAGRGFFSTLFLFGAALMFTRVTREADGSPHAGPVQQTLRTWR